MSNSKLFCGYISRDNEPMNLLSTYRHTKLHPCDLNWDKMHKTYMCQVFNESLNVTSGNKKEKYAPMVSAAQVNIHLFAEKRGRFDE